MPAHFARSTFLAGIACLACAPTLAAAPDAGYPLEFEAQVGPRTLTLPVPAGFATPAQAPAALVSILRSGLQSRAQLLGALVPQEIANADALNAPAMGRYLLVDAPGQPGGRGISAHQFELFKASVRRQPGNLLKVASKHLGAGIEGMNQDARRLSGDSSMSLGIDVGEPLGIFDDEEGAIAVANLGAATVDSQSGRTQRQLVVASGFMRVRGQFVNVNAYAPYTGQADVDWAEGQVRDWMHRAEALNPPDAHDEAPPVPDHVQAKVGTQLFSLPVLAGYADPADTPAAMLNAVTAALPATNRFVSFMLQQQTLDALSSGDSADSQGRYMGIQTFNAVEQQGIDAATFAQIKAQLGRQSAAQAAKLKQEMAHAARRASTQLGQDLGEDVQVQAGLLDSVGVFEDQPDAIMFTALQNISVQVSGQARQVRQATAGCAIRLHGQLLLAGAYTHYASPADMAWVKAQVREWARRVRELNP